MFNNIFVRCVAAIFLLTGPWVAAHAQFDHGHKAWDALLKKHVVLQQGGKASSVRYTGFRADEAALKAYTESLLAQQLAAWKSSQSSNNPQTMEQQHEASLLSPIP